MEKLRQIEIDKIEEIKKDPSRKRGLELNFHDHFDLFFEICDLKRVKFVEVKKSQIASLPDCFEQLKNLTRLSLFDSYIPKNIDLLNSLETLEIVNCELEEIPEQVWNISSLTRLSVVNCGIISVSDDISDLSGLRWLELKGNKLSVLPETLANLPLYELNLEKNRFKDIPPPIFNITSLKNLNISYNEINFVDSKIDNLKSLKQLNLSHNLIKTLPKEIGNILGIDSFYVKENPDIFIPKQISRLPNLEDSDLIEIQPYLEANELEESLINLITGDNYEDAKNIFGRYVKKVQFKNTKIKSRFLFALNKYKKNAKDNDSELLIYLCKSLCFLLKYRPNDYENLGAYYNELLEMSLYDEAIEVISYEVSRQLSLRHGDEDIREIGNDLHHTISKFNKLNRDQNNGFSKSWRLQSRF